MADDFEPSAPPVSRPFLEYRPLLRAVGIASDAKKLILATVGLLLFDAGWWAFGEPEPRLSRLAAGRSPIGFDDFSAMSVPRIAWVVIEPFREIVRPFAALFTSGPGPRQWFEIALMAVWAVVVWGIFGGAITRIAVVQAAGDHRVGLGSALRFALRKTSSLVGAPLTPFLAVGFFAGCCALFGLLYRIPWGVGSVVAAVLGFLPLLIGVMMTLILLGLGAGWPLMIATVAAEGEDAPDALSRSYSYVNQRSARYAVHVAASLVIGTVGLMVVSLFARLVVGLSDWGVSLGASEIPPTAQLFWAQVVGMVVHGWVYSYFWSSASIVYLILRRDVDGTAWQDVYLPEHAADSFAGDPEPIPAKVETEAEAEAS